MQETILFKNPSEIVNTIKQYPKNKIIFWIGAGIDNEKPTALPLGNGLLNFLLEHTCGPETSKKILRTFRKKRKVLISRCDGVSVEKYPRLETVIEAIRNFESNLKAPVSVLKGFKSFLDALPNNNHYVLASFLNEGCNIITTNFDNCIPKAYNDIFTGRFEISLSPQKDESGVYTYKSNNKKAGRIYHIHGVANHIEDLGASLSIVKNSLPEEFIKKLDEWIDDDYCFVFMGYSGLDTLDVNKYFIARNRSLRSTGIYVRHCHKLKQAHYKELNKTISSRERVLLRSFNEQKLCIYNTGELLKQFGEFSLSSCPFQWEERFEIEADQFEDKLRLTLILGIADSLGINITKLIPLKWWLKIKNYDLVSEWYINYYSFCAAMLLNNRKLMQEFGSKVQSTELMNSDIAAAINDYASAAKCSKSLNELLSDIKQHIKNNEKINWDISTPLNRKVSLILFDIIKCRRDIQIAINRNNEDANIIMNCLQMIVDAGNDHVLGINQINTAYRALGLCEMIFNQNLEAAKKNLNFALINYSEISSVNGLAVTYVYYSIVYSFAFYNERKRILFANALRFGLKSLRIIISVGLFKYLYHSFYAILLALYLLIFRRNKQA